jgi:chromatin segregation and condensation protein Rec8/ScpA/Scc1 (kleisin family)
MLIAVLEFARLRRISISQRGNFAPLLVVRESADAPD